MGPGRNNAYSGVNLPVALMQSMKPTANGHRESDTFAVFGDSGPFPCFTVRLREDVDHQTPFQTTYTMYCMDMETKPIQQRTFSVKESSIMKALQSNLRAVASELFHEDAYWLFGNDSMPLIDRYLNVPEGTEELAQRMLEWLTEHPSDGQSNDSLFTLATQRGCTPLESNTPTILVRLLDRTNSDFPLCVESICSIGPEFIDIRPVVGIDRVSGIAAVLDGVLKQVATTLSFCPQPFQPTGFWRCEDTVQALKETQCGSDSAFLHMFGSGVLFAYALQKIFNYEVECLCEPPEYEGEPWFCRITHAYCVDGDYLIDVRGIAKNRDEFFEHWAGQMLPMRETIVLSCDSMEDFIRRCSKDISDNVAVAEFIRRFCDYYDTGLLPHSIRAKRNTPCSRCFEPCEDNALPF